MIFDQAIMDWIPVNDKILDVRMLGRPGYLEGSNIENIEDVYPP